MSALAGIISLEGVAVESDQLSRLAVPCPRLVSRMWRRGVAGFSYQSAGKETSSQPFCDAASGVVVMLDGHIDSRTELRESCVSAGVMPASDSDIELVLRAYQVWREDFARHLLGEYAIAIWNPARHQLLCARDTAGVRPLFYTHLPGTLRFASRANQLLSDPELPKVPDLHGMVDVLIGRGTSAPQRTPSASVRRLPAGHVLILDKSGLRISRYWSPQEDMQEGMLPRSREHRLEAFSAALVNAVRDRVRGHGPIGISLSGGWDTGVIFLICEWLRSQGEPMPSLWAHTYYWDSPENDERAEVAALLERSPAATSTILHVPESGCTLGLEQHIEELGMPEPWMGWFFVREQSASARRAGVSTILSGEGGNFVSESSPLRPWDLLNALRLRDARAQLEIWSRELGRPVPHLCWATLLYGVLPRMFPGLAEAVTRARRAVGGTNRSCLTSSSQEIARELADSARKEHRSIFSGQPFGMQEKQSALDILTREMFPVWTGSELEGIALATPFLDRRVIVTGLQALAAEEGAVTPRSMLSSVAERIGGTPARKHGDAGETWSRTLINEIRAGNRLFDCGHLIDLGIVERNRLKALIAEHLEGKDHALLLWRLVSLEAWTRIWLAGEKPASRGRPATVFFPPEVNID